MKYFSQEVIETREYIVQYIVKAQNAAKASDKIAIGETEKETEIRLERVARRDEFGALEQCEAPAEDKPEQIKVIMSSGEYGDEEFPCDSMAEAKQRIADLRKKIKEQKDMFERKLSIVVCQEIVIGGGKR